MSTFRWRHRGFSLIELLVVLVIVTILAVVGIAMLGDRRGGGVRSVMDELEGALTLAQKGTITTVRDVYVCTDGNWLSNTLIMDGRPLIVPEPVPTPWPTAGDLTPGDDTKRQGSAGEVFRSKFGTDRDHQYAGVDVGNNWYADALGTCPALAGVVPINAQPDFVTALANPLFTGATNNVVINGQTQRFMTGFCITVIGLNSVGQPVKNGPIGIIVVPRNSSSIFKFYKTENANEWRRL